MNLQFLETIFGTASLGSILVILMLKVLPIMTRHTIVLTGQCLDQAGTLQDGRHRYRLRVQSLESIAAEHPVHITILGVADGATGPNDDADRVHVLAGWKSVAAEKRPLRNQSDGSYVWKAEFQELPAFDTWSFDVVLPSSRVKLIVSGPNAQARPFLLPSFDPYFEPDELTVFSTDLSAPRVNGPVATPRIVLPFVLSLLAPTTHTLFAGLNGVRWMYDNVTLTDVWLMIAEILLIWVGYFFLRRPVYPVIQGYRCVTPPWGAVSPAKHKVPPPAGSVQGDKSKEPLAVHGDDGTG